LESGEHFFLISKKALKLANVANFSLKVCWKFPNFLC